MGAANNKQAVTATNDDKQDDTKQATATTNGEQDDTKQNNNSTDKDTATQNNNSAVNNGRKTIFGVDEKILLKYAIVGIIIFYVLYIITKAVTAVCEESGICELFHDLNNAASGGAFPFVIVGLLIFALITGFLPKTWRDAIVKKLGTAKTDKAITEEDNKHSDTVEGKALGMAEIPGTTLQHVAAEAANAAGAHIPVPVIGPIGDVKPGGDTPGKDPDNPGSDGK